MNFRFPIVLVVCGAAIAVFIKFFSVRYPQFDQLALYVADLVMLFLSLAAWAVVHKNKSTRPQGYINSIYGATMLRLFAGIIGIMSYAVVNRAHLHKPTIFMMFGIYLAFTVIETVYVSQMARKA